MTARHSPSSLQPHASVMLHEMLAALNPKGGECYVDGTFGAGGYSRAILEAADCQVYAMDRDAHVGKFAEELKAKFDGRFVFLSGNFSQMVAMLAEQGVERVDGIVLDIGVSSMQLDSAERGFSFLRDGALDMRMAGVGISAADVVNEMEEGALADIIFAYGEEHASRHIAKAIVKARENAPITTTKQLAEIVANVLGRGGKTNPATRTFQALRIHVNDELGELERALKAAEILLAPGGRLVVVTFHSLEDRIVKRFFTARGGKTQGVSRHVPQIEMALPAKLFEVHPKAILATETEIKNNPRARSAKLRWGVRTDAEIRR